MKFRSMYPRLLLVIITLIFILPVLFAQEITLVTTGEGETKREAITDALRSAIEQSYTTFVSANTSILDDEVVKDDAVTITSGNIKTYKELSCVKTSGGFYEATVSATVSIGKLIKFAKSHGSRAEFAGNTVAMNMKMRELNKKNEQEVLNNLITSLNNNAADLFTGKIKVNSTRKQGSKIIVPIELTVTTNENFLTFKDYLFETLAALSLSPQEVEEYNQNNEPYVMISKKFYPYKYGLHIIKEPKDAFFYLRGDREEIRNFMEQLSQILDRSFRNVMVRENGGTGKTASVPQSELSFSVVFNRDGYFEEDKNKGGNVTKPYFSVGPRVPMVVAGEKVDGKFQPVDLPFEKNHVLYKGELNILYNSSDEISKVSGYEVFSPANKSNNQNRNKSSQSNNSTKKTQSGVGSSQRVAK